MNKIFIHPTIFFMAAYEKNSDSSAIFQLARDQEIEIISSTLACLEVKRNLEANTTKQLQPEQRQRFFVYISLLSHLEKTVSLENLPDHLQGLDLPQKELIFLLQASQNQADTFLTLSKHYFTPALRQKDLGLAIETPDHFLLNFTEKPSKKQETLF